MTAPRLVERVFTVGTSTFTPPAGVKHIFAKGVGGGGSGGKGEYASLVAYSLASGGSGGGASTESVVPLTLTPGTSYDIIVGAGGATTVTNGADGRAGGDSRIQPTGGSVANELVCWPGARPGLAGGDGSAVGAFKIGGMAVRDGLTTSDLPTAFGGAYHTDLGKGGYGTYSGAAVPAGRGASSDGGIGGAGGGNGASAGGTSQYKGGGGGGGGAAGVGAGGTGGTGGNASIPNGVAGSAGAAGSGYGSGGGGGGAGGSGSGSGAAGGNGGAGAPGRIVLFWWE